MPSGRWQDAVRPLTGVRGGDGVRLQWGEKTSSFVEFGAGSKIVWPHGEGRQNTDLSDACANAPAKLPNDQSHGIPQCGQRRMSRARDLRRCPHDGHYSHSGPQTILAILQGFFQRFASRNRNNSSPCAQRRMPHIRGIRRCAH